MAVTLALRICTIGSLAGTESGSMTSRNWRRSGRIGNSISYFTSLSAAATPSSARRTSASAESGVTLTGKRMSRMIVHMSGTMLAPRSSSSRPRPPMIVPTFSRGRPGRSGSGWPVSLTVSSACTTRAALAMALMPCSMREMCTERPSTWTASSITPVCFVMMCFVLYGSGTTAMSARTPFFSMCTVPTPPCSSPSTHATTMSPRRRPARRAATAPMIMAATPPFML
jgi:hypothetical protein